MGKDVDVTLSEEQWGYIVYFAHYSSMASKYQELCYKILTWWYRVPSLLNKIYPERTNTCWRCGEAEGNMLHIFWSCGKLGEFWSKVRDIIGQLTDYDLGADPARYLLHLSDFSKHKYRNSMIVHLLNAAKGCVLALWKQESPPSASLWLKKIANIYAMKKGIAITQAREERFNKK